LSPEASAPGTPPSQDVSPTAAPPPTTLDHTPRRFHMSRSATPVGSTPTVAGRKRKNAAIFVERKRPRSSEGPTETPQLGKVAAQGPSKQDASQPEQEKPGPGFGTPQSEERPRKKPGLAARSSTPPVRLTSTSKPLVAPLRNVRLPSGAMMPWDVSSERLTAEMQAYTLEEIGRTLARQDEEAAAEASRLAALKAAKSASSPQKYSSKFKPKKPALRYAERHPGEKVVPEHEAMEVDEAHIGDEDDEDMDDGEYIIDTYVRIPADALQTNEQPKNFGLLVLDSQPDIDEFYQEEENSDEEDDDEEEDENGTCPPPSFSSHHLSLSPSLQVILTCSQRKTTTQPTTRTRKSPPTTNSTGTLTTTAQATPPISKSTTRTSRRMWR
jgi:hypothetical protein